LSYRLIRRPLLWVAVGAAMLVALACTFAYIDAFLDPNANAHRIPIAVVSEDAGATIAGQRVDVGKQVVAGILAVQSDAVAWTRLPSRAAALARMHENKAFAAIVVPQDTSARLAGLLAPTPGAKPRVVILTNAAAGTIARSSGQQVATETVARAGHAVGTQLQLALGAAGLRLPAAAKAALVAPFATTVTAGVPIGAKTAEGVSPFFFSLTVAIGGFFLAAIVSFGVDLAAGRDGLEVLGRTLGHERADASDTHLVVMKLVLTIVFAALTAALQTLLAVKVLGMETTNPVALASFSALGSAAVGTITLLCLVAFDLVGRIVAALFTLIFGVPSSGGVYPTEVVPGFFRWLGEFLPLQQMTSGARSLVFYDGRSGAGLGTALWVLSGYLIVSVLLTVVVDRLLSRRRPEAAIA
jgi:YhgE/Pip-like protein